MQFITAQGLVIGNLIKEFKTLDREVSQVVRKAYCEGRQIASQTIVPMPSSPVLCSHLVPWLMSGIINRDSINKDIYRLRYQGLLGQALATSQEVEPQPIKVSDDGGEDWLSLRLPGEPQQDQPSG